jgi:hypothetical protein
MNSITIKEANILKYIELTEKKTDQPLLLCKSSDKAFD